MVIFGHRRGGSNPPKILKLPFFGKIFKFQGGSGPPVPPSGSVHVYTLHLYTCFCNVMNSVISPNTYTGTMKYSNWTVSEERKLDYVSHNTGAYMYFEQLVKIRSASSSDRQFDKLKIKKHSPIINKDYHMGILVIACSINPILHYQAQAQGLIMIEASRVGTKGDNQNARVICSCI